MTDAVAELRKEALLMIDMAAGQARARYVTEVPGQRRVYDWKVAEAQAYLADPTAAAGPHLAAESEETGIPVADLAALVMLRDAHFREVVSPQAEARRRGAKVRLLAHTTASGIRAEVAEALAVLAAI